jgi:hypothetical protein
MGLIPKKGRPGKFCLIVNRRSVNDGIDPAHCSFHYSSVSYAARRVVECGRGVLLAKLDLKSAYRMVPVHLIDSPLLGISWKGSTYIDKALPFSLRSAPIIFSAVADGLAWALFSEGVEYSIHYLDDFLFCSPAALTACQVALQKALPLCERLGLPVAPEKIEDPCTRLSFLGITIDSQSMMLSLPEAKLIQLQDRLEEWTSRKSATIHQLQELLGHLNYAAAVVRTGQTFLRAVIEKTVIPSSIHPPGHPHESQSTWSKLFAESSPLHSQLSMMHRAAVPYIDTWELVSNSLGSSHGRT